MNRREFLSAAASLPVMAKTPQRRTAGRQRPADEIGWMTATDLARAIRTRAVSAVEVMEACLARIKRVNPAVNAICTLVDEDRSCGRRGTPTRNCKKSARVGPLHGFPHAVKDLVPTAGIRTTYGSRIYQDNIPAEDALIVERIKAAGRDHHRQDQHPGVRRRIADLQCGLRGDAESVRSRPERAAAAPAAAPWRSPAG